MKSNKVDFLNQIATSQSNNYQNVLTMFGGPCSRPAFKIVEVPGIEPATLWLVITHADPQINDLLYKCILLG